MEARQTLTGSSVSKGLLVVLAASAAVALATTGGIFAKNFGATGAQVQGILRPAPGTVLRQDNPAQAGDSAVRSAPGRSNAGRMGGNQYFIESGSSADDQAGSDLIRVLPTETQGNTPGRDLSDRPGFRA